MIGPSNEERILILTGTVKDAALASETLAQVGLHAVVCRRLAEALELLSEGGAALLLAQEVLTAAEVTVLLDALESQPTWSDLPIALLTAPGAGYHASHGIVDRLRPTCNLTLLERPLQKLTLVSAMQVALRSRRRQYQVRDLLKKLEASRLELHDKIADLEKFEQVVVGRELRMIELERENAQLARRLRDLQPNGKGHHDPPSHPHPRPVEGREERARQRAPSPPPQP